MLTPTLFKTGGFNAQKERVEEDAFSIPGASFAVSSSLRSLCKVTGRQFDNLTTNNLTSRQ